MTTSIEQGEPGVMPAPVRGTGVVCSQKLPPKYQRRLREQADEFETLARRRISAGDDGATDGTEGLMKSARDDLLAALRKSRKALAAFEGIPPSHQKRWLEYVAEAKQPETRARRIKKCMQDLSKDRKARSTGYSGTPLLQKLGIKDGHRVALLEAPRKLPEALAAVRPIAESKVKPGVDPFDVIVLFADRKADLDRRFREAARCLDPAGGLWVAWPKRASGVPTDLTEDVVREIALAAGLVDNKVCAIDGIWSGLRCVYRVKDRPAGSA